MLERVRPDASSRRCMARARKCTAGRRQAGEAGRVGQAARCRTRPSRRTCMGAGQGAASRTDLAIKRGNMATRLTRSRSTKRPRTSTVQRLTVPCGRGLPTAALLRLPPSALPSLIHQVIHCQVLLDYECFAHRVSWGVGCRVACHVLAPADPSRPLPARPCLLRALPASGLGCSVLAMRWIGGCQCGMCYAGCVARRAVLH